MIRIAVAVIAVSLTAAGGAADTFFVAPTGSNMSSGSAEAPWESLQYAADKVGPGDRVVVRAGEYIGFHLTSSGVAGSPIEFIAEPGAVVNMRNPTTPDGINLEGASHVVIDGFEVVGMPRAGVRTVGPYVNSQQSFAEFVTIRNVTSRDNGRWGIFTGFVNDLLIENNRTSGSIDEHGIYVSNSGDRPVIRGNEIWGNHANGIHVNGDQYSGLDGVIEEALIAGNTIYDNGVGGGSGINLDGVENSRIENNLIYNSHASGISLYQIDGAEPSTGNVVINNTIHEASDGRWALNLQDGASNNTIANNILLSDHNFRGAIDASSDSLPGLVSDYNIVISRFTTDGGNTVLTLSEWQTFSGLDTHSVVASADELFVDAGDYRLVFDSPARDAGWNLWGADNDLVGTPRPVGATVDIGAYEWLLAGDYNNDGVVNAGDYAAWLANLGAPAGTLPNDADGGTIGPAQYATWKANFGATADTPQGSPPLTAIPEPNAATLLVIPLAVIASYPRNS